MAAMKFFFRITPPADPLRFLGLLYAAKMAALKQNADTRQILIRADLHRQTFDPKLRKWVKDRLHYTIDLKDAKMIQEKKHLTFHGYITESPDSKTFTNMFLVTEVKPRDNDKDGSPRVEKDEYVNKETGETLNSWDPDLHDLREMDEPPALRDLGFGDLFISVSTKYLADLKTTAEAEKALEKAAKEEMAAREEALKK